MDVIDKLKNSLKKEAIPNIVQGSATAYDEAMALTDEQLKKFYLGVAPYDRNKDIVYVPREVQEELYKRFVAPQLKFGTCSQCHNRGWTAWNPALNQVEPCMCVQSAIRKESADENTKDNKIILLNN